MEVGWDPVLVTVTFLDQWRSVGLVFQGGFMVFHGFWLVFMIFPGSFMVVHGFLLVSMVFQCSFMVYHGFWLFSIVLLVENTTKLYLGPTIRRPALA